MLRQDPATPFVGGHVHVSLVLHPFCPVLDHALVVEVLSAANRAAGSALFSHDIRSVTGDAVPTRDGPVIEVTANGWQRDPCVDLVLVLAGQDPLAHLPMGLRGFLGTAARSGATLGGLGGVVAVLARLGMLNGHSAALPDDLRTLDPDGWPLVAPAKGDHALDRRRLSAVGGLAVVEEVLAWITQASSPQLAVKTARLMGYPAGKTAPVRAAGDPVLNQMQALMEARLDDPLSIDTICDALDLTAKQLLLRCRKQMGRTPAQVYQDLRLDRAAALLAQTALPVSDVARAESFASHSSFTRGYRSRFQKLPRDARTRAA